MTSQNLQPTSAFDSLDFSSGSSLLDSLGDVDEVKGVDVHRELAKFGNVTTYSGLEILYSCPREYLLHKLRANDPSQPGQNMENIHFCFGHAVGSGVAEFDRSRDMNKALLECLLAWNLPFFAEGEAKDYKSIAAALWAVYTYQGVAESELEDYEVVEDGLEHTFVINTENGYFHSGHIDTLLRSKTTGDLLVKENKTTKFANVDPAMYSNSLQGLGYNVIAAMKGQSEYETMYAVYSTIEQQWIVFRFVKTLLDRVEWIKDILMTHHQLDKYYETDFFPRRGGSCLRFGRRCQFYGECDLPALQQGADDLPDADLKDLIKLQATHTVIKLSDLVATLKKKTGLEP